MNLLKYELKIKARPLLFWLIGMFSLVISGSMEFEGLAETDSESMAVLLAYYPPIVLSLLGITEQIDFLSLGGYTWVLGYYVTVIAGFYAITLGSSVANREFIDKTYEFLFTKPRQRSYVLCMKILSAVFCLTLFSLATYTSNLFLMSPLDKSVDIGGILLLHAVATYVVSLIFFAVSLFVSLLLKRDKASKVNFTLFLSAFILGGLIDVGENLGFLRVFTPLRYFVFADVESGNFPVGFLALSFGIIAMFLLFAFRIFSRKDFKDS